MIKPIVVILQEYVPQYRVPFFRRLIELGAENGIDIQIAAGTANRNQHQRQDSVPAEFTIPISQTEVRIANTRLVFRRVAPVISTANLVIMEQARRNIDAYWLLLSPWQRRKICLWGHGRDFVTSPSWIKRQAMSRLTRAADWFFAYTEGSRDSVVSSGYPLAQTTVVQNSIDTADLQNDMSRISPAQVGDFRREKQLSHLTAIFVGGLDESKRLPFLFEACRHAFRMNENFRLLVVGSGPLRESVERLTETEPWLRYLGPLFGTEKALAIAAADLICMPGRVGLVAVDSFATGRPIVTTPWPWHGPEFEYLEDGKTCVVSAGGEQSYAKALMRLLTDKQELRTMQEACRSAREKYTIEEMAARFFEGIQRALTYGSGEMSRSSFDAHLVGLGRTTGRRSRLGPRVHSQEAARTASSIAVVQPDRLARPQWALSI
ncbi:glycosyltransferase family 4 protein [Arthrobacter sp. Soil762]|uniref:glycosyltransferase family 4 protein n=1 Tax=Arthrobacter sp. Soil762 TaxID=1736401 RepID=UPI0009E73A45|nr:glycosyltransferase family 4 protein [Arthrobacter sp. Soil762]